MQVPPHTYATARARSFAYPFAYVRSVKTCSLVLSTYMRGALPFRRFSVTRKHYDFPFRTSGWQGRNDTTESLTINPGTDVSDRHDQHQALPTAPTPSSVRMDPRAHVAATGAARRSRPGSMESDLVEVSRS